jgi:hypothetical protein
VWFRGLKMRGVGKVEVVERCGRVGKEVWREVKG